MEQHLVLSGARIDACSPAGLENLVAQSTRWDIEGLSSAVIYYAGLKGRLGKK